MKLNAKKLKASALFLFISIALLNVWSTRPVTIIHISRQRIIDIDIVVDHFPMTYRDRIHWYVEHKAELREKYDVPWKSINAITIWDMGGGFLSYKNNESRIDDLYCFSDMKVDARCIEKNIPLVVNLKGNNEEVFDMGYSGYSYTVDSAGKLVATKDEALFDELRQAKDKQSPPE